MIQVRKLVGASPTFWRQVIKHANRLELSVSAYIRLVVNNAMGRNNNAKGKGRKERTHCQDAE